MNSEIKNWKAKPIPIEESGAIPIPTGECSAVKIDYDLDKEEITTHYERVNIVTSNGEFIVGRRLVKCHQCGTMTNLHEICYETPFCSDACVIEFDKKLLAEIGGKDI